MGDGVAESTMPLVPSHIHSLPGEAGVQPAGLNQLSSSVVYTVIWKSEQFPFEEVALILEDLHITDGFFHEAVCCKLCL